MTLQYNFQLFIPLLRAPQPPAPLFSRVRLWLTHVTALIRPIFHKEGRTIHNVLRKLLVILVRMQMTPQHFD